MFRALPNSSHFDQHTTAGKLFVLMLMSIALIILPVPITAILAPIPIVLAFLLYGRLMAFGVGAFTVGLISTWSMVDKGFPPHLMGLYLMVFFYAVLVAEIILRNINPVKGLIYTGFILVFLSGSFLLAFDRLNPITLKGEISQSVSTVLMQLKKQRELSPTSGASAEDERKLDDFLNKPEALSNEIYSSLPFLVFIVCYFVLWVCLFAVLQMAIKWRYKVLYSYGLKDLTNFKTPDFLVYPLILSLVLYLGADYGLPSWSEVVGKNLLYCTGLFYLFQGLGIYNDFLKFLRMGFILRAMFMLFALVFMNEFLAVFGIFDLWFDFRRFFTNLKKDKGDTI